MIKKIMKKAIAGVLVTALALAGVLSFVQPVSAAQSSFETTKDEWGVYNTDSLGFDLGTQAANTYLRIYYDAVDATSDYPGFKVKFDAGAPDWGVEVAQCNAAKGLADCVYLKLSDLVSAFTTAKPGVPTDDIGRIRFEVYGGATVTGVDVVQMNVAATGTDNVDIPAGIDAGKCAIIVEYDASGSAAYPGTLVSMNGGQSTNWGWDNSTKLSLVQGQVSSAYVSLANLAKTMETEYSITYEAFTNVFVRMGDKWNGPFTVSAVKLLVPETVELASKSTSLKAGKTFQLKTITGLTADSFSSSDESVATVSDTGLITAVAGGSATITAKNTAKNLTDKFTITVTDKDVVSFKETSKTIELPSGTYTVEIDGQIQPVAGSWESSKPAVATVDQNGKITAKAVGEANITCKSADGVVSTFVVTVKNPAAVELSKTSVSIDDGKTAEITVKKGTVVSWTSSDSKIATVSDGVITGKLAGTCKVIATDNVGRETEVEVTVNKVLVKKVPQYETSTSTTTKVVDKSMDVTKDTEVFKHDENGFVYLTNGFGGDNGDVPVIGFADKYQIARKDIVSVTYFLKYGEVVKDTGNYFNAGGGIGQANGVLGWWNAADGWDPSKPISHFDEKNIVPDENGYASYTVKVSLTDDEAYDGAKTLCVFWWDNSTDKSSDVYKVVVNYKAEETTVNSNAKIVGYKYYIVNSDGSLGEPITEELFNAFVAKYGEYTEMDTSTGDSANVGIYVAIIGVIAVLGTAYVVRRKVTKEA